METLYIAIIAVAAAGMLVLLRQIMRNYLRKDDDIKQIYKDIVFSDEHKVKGRFD